MIVPRPAAVAVMLGACRPWLPLADVPITGGTVAERATVRHGLLEFEELAGPGRVQLRRVEIREEVRFGAEGLTNTRGVVHLRHGLEPAWLGEVLRHELCHDLDYAESLVVSAPGALARLSDVVNVKFGSVFAEADVDPIEETYALYCEFGPLTAAMVATACPGDDPDLSEVAAWLTAEVWRGARPELRLDEDRVASHDVGVDLAEAALSVDVGGEYAFVYIIASGVEPPEVQVDTFVDLQSGAEVDPDGFDRLEFERVHSDSPDYTEPVDMGGDTGLWIPKLEWDGQQLGMFSVYGWHPDNVHGYDYPEDQLAPRALVFDGEGWTAVIDGCAREGQNAFVTPDGTFWMSWVEGTRVLWAPIVPFE